MTLSLYMTIIFWWTLCFWFCVAVRARDDGSITTCDLAALFIGGPTWLPTSLYLACEQVLKKDGYCREIWKDKP